MDWIALGREQVKWAERGGVDCETHREKDCEMKSESERDGWIALQGENIHPRETNRENVRQ